MDRRDFFFEQEVTEEELNGAFDAVETAMFRMMTDQGLFGILQGMVAAQVTPVANLSITLSGPGFAYDQAGQRITVASPFETINCSQDFNSVTTAVTGAGNEKWVSVFVKATRSLSDPRTDGNGHSVYFQSNESKQYVIVQGAEAPIGTATRPDKDPTMLLVDDVHLEHGDTQIFNAAIHSDRRDDVIVIDQTPVSIRAGTPLGAVTAMLTALNDHIENLSGAHPSTAITESGYTGTNFSVASATVHDAVVDLATAIDTGAIHHTILPAWKDGSQIAAGTVGSQLDAIPSSLANSTSAPGAALVGAAAVGTIGAGSVASQIASLETRTGAFKRVVGVYAASCALTSFDHTGVTNVVSVTTGALQVGDVVMVRSPGKFKVTTSTWCSATLAQTGGSGVIDAIDANAGEYDDNIDLNTPFDLASKNEVTTGGAITVSVGCQVLFSTGSAQAKAFLEVIVYR